MRQIIYEPAKSKKRMDIVCFVSGSGTNYREIVINNPDHNYLVFTNRPDCAGVSLAKINKHAIIILSHATYLNEARRKYGPGMVPKNCAERIQYEKEACKMIEQRLGKRPDLICLAGYDQWISDWTVERYYPHILNVHPGDTTKGYNGLHWVPTAKAILAEDKALRSTLFIVDKGEDTGPILAQSAPLNIVQTLEKLEAKGNKGLLEGLNKVKIYSAISHFKTFEDFMAKADKNITGLLETICRHLQNALKVSGDWKIYPFAIDLIASGRVETDAKLIYVDGKELPPCGYRLDDIK
jgi:folate-dependent phosphoribosylglycinamide formyltransferase PurN